MLVASAAPRRSGNEPFHAGGRSLDFSLLEFWQWSVSDLVSNATRGRLAEFIVAHALGGPTSSVRDEWAAFDLTSRDGIKIDVKSAAYLQAWHQRTLSSTVFRTPPSRAWDPETNRLATELAHQADVYVFARLAHQDKSRLDPLDVNQWRFYVLPTATLKARTRSRNSITLASLDRLCSGVPYHGLAAAVREARKA